MVKDVEIEKKTSPKSREVKTADAGMGFTEMFPLHLRGAGARRAHKSLQEKVLIKEHANHASQTPLPPPLPSPFVGAILVYGIHSFHYHFCLL